MAALERENARLAEGIVAKIDHLIDIEPERITRIEWSHTFDEFITEVPPYAPVAVLVRLCQGVAWNSVTDAAVIEFVGDCCEACLDVSETVLVGVLSQTHDEETGHGRRNS